MIKLATTAFLLLLSFAAFNAAVAQKRGHYSGATSLKPALKFLDAIHVNTVEATPVLLSNAVVPKKEESEPAIKTETVSLDAAAIESATALQLKYAVLLNTEVEQIQNATLFSAIDEWFGTRYVLGGSNEDGIDCSAFVQAVYARLFQIPMPRTAKEQYKAVRSVSRTELKEGDLVFFNTRGRGVSHVGIYLQNNKFAHAASSGGVMISDLFEDYWVARYLSAGRYENCQPLAAKP